MSASKDDAFWFDSEGYLTCGNLRVSKLVNVIKGLSVTTPCFLYSKKKIIENFMSYKESFDQLLTKEYNIKTNISYSLKANFNPHILNVFHQYGSWCSLVNENELNLALKVGYTGSHLIFNGNGKTEHEIEKAIEAGCYLNVDSMFNLMHTIKICKRFEEGEKRLVMSRGVKLLIRINPSIDAAVHPYLTTSIKTSKFGVNIEQVEDMIRTIKENSKYVDLIGYHCHLGSTITSVDVYRECVQFLVGMVDTTRTKFGVNTIRLLNFGGGLGINYYKFSNRTTLDQKPELQIPTPRDLAAVLVESLKDVKDIEVVVEPGRSLIANTSILLTKLIGAKHNENKNFLVIDGSMCEVIRPCLYGAYHHVEYIEPVNKGSTSSKCFYDIVGPVCESGDFLGKDRYLDRINEDNDDGKEVYLAVFDVGAYCGAMASNYNMHLKPAEILIHNENDDDDGTATSKYQVIRKSDTFDYLMQPYEFNFQI